MRAETAVTTTETSLLVSICHERLEVRGVVASGFQRRRGHRRPALDEKRPSHRHLEACGFESVVIVEHTVSGPPNTTASIPMTALGMLSN